MQKDFEGWNIRKQDIDKLGKRALYHERELWWCVLGANIGFEQDGTGTGYERPVLVLRGFSADVCLVIPLTTSKKENPYHMNLGLVAEKEAFAVISQLRLIDTRRLVEKIGYLNKDRFEYIRKAVKGML